MSAKLKLVYLSLFIFSLVSVLSFQNCSQQSSTQLGDFTAPSTNGGTGTGCTNLSTSTLLSQLLMQSPFQFILTDDCGNVVAYGTNQTLNVPFSIQRKYRLYIVGIENAMPNPQILPQVDKWIGCGIVANSDSNYCTSGNFPTTQLANNPEGCSSTAQRPFRPLNCDPQWRVESINGKSYIVNYNYLRNTNGQVYVPSGVVVYNYFKPNDPSVSSAIRFVFQTGP